METKNQTEEEEYQEEEEDLFSILELERQDWDEGKTYGAKGRIEKWSDDIKDRIKVSWDGAVRRKADEDEEAPLENSVLY